MTTRPDQTDVRWAAGCTVFQLDRWCTLGLIPDQPARIGSGKRRTWTDDQIRVLGVLTAAADTRTERGLTVIAEQIRHADWTSPLWIADGLITIWIDLPGIAADIATRRAM